MKLHFFYLAVDEQNKAFVVVTLSGRSNLAGRSNDTLPASTRGYFQYKNYSQYYKWMCLQCLLVYSLAHIFTCLFVLFAPPPPAQQNMSRVFVQFK